MSRKRRATSAVTPGVTTMTRGSPTTNRCTTNSSAPTTKNWTTGSRKKRAGLRVEALGEGLTIVSAADTDEPLYLQSIRSPPPAVGRRLAQPCRIDYGPSVTEPASSAIS